MGSEFPGWGKSLKLEAVRWYAVRSRQEFRGPRKILVPPVKSAGLENDAAARKTELANEIQESGESMDNWKKGVLAGSVAAATVLFLKRRHAAGILVSGVGLALLAAEYPDKFEQVRQSLPDYFERGMRVMEMAARAGKRITDAAGQSGFELWDEVAG